MNLVDTSVWVNHFRRSSAKLSQLLADGQVLCHPFVIGELACGSLQNREEVLLLLAWLPVAEPADDNEVLAFIDRHRLFGRGLGWIDMHLLASALLSGAVLWTDDARLRRAALDLGIAS